jgi:hypothetical protein
MPPANPYSRAALTGEEPKPTLADIPLDAPYAGDHVLYRWDAATQSWAGYDAWDSVHDTSGESLDPESPAAKKPVKRSPRKHRKGDPDLPLPLYDGQAS